MIFQNDIYLILVVLWAMLNLKSQSIKYLTLGQERTGGVTNTNGRVNSEKEFTIDSLLIAVVEEIKKL